MYVGHFWSGEIICFCERDFAIMAIVYVKNRKVKSSDDTEMAFVINKTLG